MNKTFNNPPEEKMRKRIQPIYNTPGDMRGDYFRDYCRILHSTAYRRLKRKTQVFFDVEHDHVCTRMEHVQHVESVSHSLAKNLGLNTELTQAIAIGHDLGHAPFGHYGETVLDKLMREYLSNDYINEHYGVNAQKLFWHERNGLRFVDFIELLADEKGVKQNLNLTYAVRDGIISHCGEVDQCEIHPRENDIDLYSFNDPGAFSPYTWEGCVVKLADKIAYLGRDIEDAITLGVISDEGTSVLKQLARDYYGSETINTTRIMHSLIDDICVNSSRKDGLKLSDNGAILMKEIKNYNYKYIYNNNALDVYKKYAKLVLTSIFDVLYSAYDDRHTISCIKTNYEKRYRRLTKEFVDWLSVYCACSVVHNDNKDFDTSYYNNEKIYSDLKDKNLYVQAIVDFISGMTDGFAIDLFNELIAF